MNIRWSVLALPLLVMLVSGGSLAHEVRPGYLRIQQVDEATYDVLWRVPARGDLRLGLYARLPDHCETRGEMRSYWQGGAYVERWTSICPGGLVGHDVAIDGLSATLTDVLARFERLDDTTQIVRLTPSNYTFAVSDSESWQQVASTYTMLGVEHILLGIDHLLFVLALLMIVEGWRKLVATVTAFTLAHSITLAAATLGFVKVPQSPVEAVIALSILFVAAEIIHWRQGRPGITRRKPWLVAFTFGLLHGFGFAGALTEIGLPEHAIPLALLFFNVGVEAGQLLFIACVVVAWSALRKFEWPEWVWRIPVYGIGTMAAFWTIERIAGF
jgi:hydrogenase/urease accessory protein HupE